MGKPRVLGMINRCIQNSKADMRYRRKTFERSKDKIESEDRLIDKDYRHKEGYHDKEKVH